MLYERALDHDPHNPDALSRMGSLLAGDGRQDEAARLQQRAAEVADIQVERWLLAAQAWRAAGDDERARAAYERVLELVPGHLEATEALADRG